MDTTDMVFGIATLVMVTLLILLLRSSDARKLLDLFTRENPDGAQELWLKMSRERRRKACVAFFLDIEWEATQECWPADKLLGLLLNLHICGMSELLGPIERTKLVERVVRQNPLHPKAQALAVATWAGIRANVAVAFLDSSATDIRTILPKISYERIMHAINRCIDDGNGERLQCIFDYDQTMVSLDQVVLCLRNATTIGSQIACGIMLGDWDTCDLLIDKIDDPALQGRLALAIRNGHKAMTT